MKTLLQLMLIAILLWSCSKGTAPTESAAAVEATFAKYPDSPGKTIYRENCNKCHRYRLPETRTADKWPGIIDKMARKAKLTDEQKAAVLEFVKSNAKAA
ncbi:cytochrome c [Chitinophaga vietnamensis]|uniref:cytochrome c n=1 Tax=Chitinophaga vietnamensis TaxID=2593957 RepID=UPI001178B065|nr:cytochrome c [Chitinophaga vietnamensis]